MGKTVKDNQRKQGIILSYIQSGLHLIANLLYVPILLKTIGQNEYGVYQLAGSVVAYINIMESFLSAGVLRYYCKYKDAGDQIRMENTLAISKRIYGEFSIIVIIVGCIAAFIVHLVYTDSLDSDELKETEIIIITLSINIVINLVNYVYHAAIKAEEKFVFLNTASILVEILQPISVICVVVMIPHAVAVVVAQVAVNLLVNAVKRHYCLNVLKVKIAYHYKDSLLVKQIMQFSGWVLLVMVAEQVFLKADQLILGKLFGAGMVAVYAVGAQIYSNYLPIGASIAGVYMPKVSELYNKEKDIKAISDIFIRTGRIAFMAACLILTGFGIYGIPFIRMWAGNEYIPAYYVALIVMIPFTITVVQNVGVVVLQVENLYAFRGKVYFAIALINLISTWFLAKKMGIVGAALSTAILILIGNGLIMNWYYGKHASLDISSFWKELMSMVPAIILALLCGLGLRLLIPVNGWTSLFINIVIYTLIYVSLLFFMACNGYEKQLLIGMFKGVIKIR